MTEKDPWVTQRSAKASHLIRSLTDHLDHFLDTLLAFALLSVSTYILQCILELCIHRFLDFTTNDLSPRPSSRFGAEMKCVAAAVQHLLVHHSQTSALCMVKWISRNRHKSESEFHSGCRNESGLCRRQLNGILNIRIVYLQYCELIRILHFAHYELPRRPTKAQKVAVITQPKILSLLTNQFWEIYLASALETKSTAELEEACNHRPERMRSDETND